MKDTILEVKDLSVTFTQYDRGFSRRTHKLLPEAICKASYEILLQKIEQYKLKDQEAV